MTFFTYIIKSQVDGRFFIGQTTNIKRRLSQHNRGLEEQTRKYRPWVLVAFKEFETRGGAMSHDRRLKMLATEVEMEDYFKNHGFTKV